MTTPRERFNAVLRFEQPRDRLPMVEWAAWWDQTLNRWKTEGLDPNYDTVAALDHFGLDKLLCLAVMGASPSCPPPTHHGAGIVTNEADYERIRPHLFKDEVIDACIENARNLKEQHDCGEIILRLWLDGFFWFPRVLFGIERHLYAFFEQPDLMRRMNEELTEFNIRAIDRLFPVLQPDMLGIAEDMSYNNGPMLSKALFDEFLKPYYQRLNAHAKQWDIPILIDSDGDITSMVPWMEEAGIEGVYPLERQAGVDVAHLRDKHPKFLMMGGFDKMVMPIGEEAMRAEFERLLPVMKSGGYIPSVDHQTPPGVSLEQYRIYRRLLDEFTA